MSDVHYAELQVTSHFSFLRGASSAGELFSQAALLGIEALAVADRNSLAGIVRAHEAARMTGVRLIVGCRLDLTDGISLLVYPTDRDAYSRLFAGEARPLQRDERPVFARVPVLMRVLRHYRDLRPGAPYKNERADAC